MCPATRPRRQSSSGHRNTAWKRRPSCLLSGRVLKWTLTGRRPQRATGRRHKAFPGNRSPVQREREPTVAGGSHGLSVLIAR